MRKLIIMTIAIGMLAGCKKGPNDPAISLRSRDQRVMGEWVLEFAEYIDKTTTSTTIDKFEGKNVTTTNTNQSGTTTTVSTSTYSVTLTIAKDGTIKYVETTTSSNGNVTTLTKNGSWAWLDGKKNKTQIMFTDLSGASFMDDGNYMVDELRHKKLVLKQSNSAELGGPFPGTTSDETTLKFNQ